VDIIWDLDWDCMHGIFLNVTGRLLNLLFGKDHSEKVFSCYNSVEIADDLMNRFQIPHSNSRSLHKLEKFKDWKAAEFR
jgi:hypothetical protein